MKAPRWDLQGWQKLTVHDDPPLVAARKEYLAYLEGVPEPDRSNWRARLLSDWDHPHLSVRLELFLHHYFRTQSWQISIEPDLPDTPNRPDFLLRRGEQELVVEAKTLLDIEQITQQSQRLNMLAEELTKDLPVQMIIEPLSDLLPSLPNRRLRHLISQQAQHTRVEIREFDISEEHQGTPFST